MTKTQKKSLDKVIYIYCEGDTEFHYFDSYRKKKKYSFKIKPIDVKGGGYSKMLDSIKKGPASGILARFVFLDFDRYISINTEQEIFCNLCNYINSQNFKMLPIFLIVSNPDFDDFVLLHDSNYNFKNKNNILTSHKYKNLNDLKGDENVFDVFNRAPCSANNALGKLNKNSIARNIFKITKSTFSINNKLLINLNNYLYRTSNIDDLFNVINSIL